jgi:TonB family protein
MATAMASSYRRGLFDPGDALFFRCLAGTAIFAVLLVILARLMPAPPPKALTHVDELPQRLARLILEPPKAMPAQSLPMAEKIQAAAKSAAPAAVVEHPAPAGGPPAGAGGRRTEAMHSLATGAGAAGRARAAAEVGGSLASATSSMQSALAGLDKSLGITSSAEGGSVARGGRSRGIREARGAADLGALTTKTGTGVGGGSAPTADLAGSAVAGSLVSIGQLAAGSGWGTGTGGEGTGSGGGGAGFGDGSGTGGGGHGAGGVMGPGVYRSNASLLTVIQRYSAGIQYCYSTELKHDPTLRGKLVVAITVAANGQVTEATVIQNSTGSSQLAACALSQIREWRFAPIASGVTAFHAPFVFTPPE